MKIFYMSDLHLEFKENELNVNNNIEKITSNNKEDVLILAGDILILEKDFFKNKTLNKLCSCFKEVYMICGNHEFYKKCKDISVLENSFIDNYHNLKLVNNYSFDINEYKIIMSTMLAKISYNNSFWIETNLNDFRQIKYFHISAL